MKSYLLGIDIGTSACKVAVFDRNGKVLAAASGDYPVYYPHEGWAEQNLEEWCDAICRATKETMQKADITADEIAGIGIDGQSWSAIPIDREGNVLANTPIWIPSTSPHSAAAFPVTVPTTWSQSQISGRNSMGIPRRSHIFSSQHPFFILKQCNP